MPDTFLLRPANPADARVLAEHRVGMFRDIGTIHPDVEAALREASIEYFASALSAGEYVGWIAYRPEPASNSVPCCPGPSRTAVAFGSVARG
jgi:hypothetical protein